MFNLLSLFAKKSTYNAVDSAQKFKESIINIGITDEKEIQFDIMNEKHKTRVIESITAVNTYLPILQDRDKRIATGFAVAGTALALAAIIPFGLTIAMSAVGYGAYFLGGRDDPYHKFNAALEDLAHCCDWALSDLSDNSKLQNENLKKMLKTLAPLVTKEDLITIMGNEDEAQRIIDALKQLSEKEPLNNKITNKNASFYSLATKDDLKYHLYGYRQGGTLASLANVVILSLQKAFAYICERVNGTTNNTSTPTFNM